MATTATSVNRLLYPGYSLSDQIHAEMDDQKPRSFNQISMLASQWADNSPHDMLHADHAQLFQTCNYGVSYPTHMDQQAPQQPLQYLTETTWASNTEIASPMAIGFPTETMATYHNIQFSNVSPHLILSSNRKHQPLPATQSPQSSMGELSPYEQPLDHHDLVSDHGNQRPALTRSITAPEQYNTNRILSSPSKSPTVKRAGSDEDDDDMPPAAEESKLRGRKRQRIPHTAVERRYRENLNAHLERLRNTVPALASKRPPGSSNKLSDRHPDALKPSKCEVLNGAIEHILTLNNENAILHTEVQALRARIMALEQWCGAQM